MPEGQHIKLVPWFENPAIALSKAFPPSVKTFVADSYTIINSIQDFICFFTHDRWSNRYSLQPVNKQETPEDRIYNYHHIAPKHVVDPMVTMAYKIYNSSVAGRSKNYFPSSPFEVFDSMTELILPFREFRKLIFTNSNHPVNAAPFFMPDHDRLHKPSNKFRNNFIERLGIQNKQGKENMLLYRWLDGDGGNNYRKIAYSMGLVDWDNSLDRLFITTSTILCYRSLLTNGFIQQADKLYPLLQEIATTDEESFSNALITAQSVGVLDKNEANNYFVQAA